MHAIQHGGLPTPADSPLVRSFIEAHNQVLREMPRVGTEGRLGAAADASIFRRMGIPTIEYGPGSLLRDLGRWPATDERVLIEDLVQCSAVIALAVAHLSANSNSSIG